MNNKSTSIGGINTTSTCNLMQPYYSYVVKKNHFNMWLCVKRKSESEKRERIIFFIILLRSLYYFIRLYVKIKSGM